VYCQKKSIKYIGFYNITVIHMRLILASTSAYRRALLARLRVPFETADPAVDETPLAGEAPAALAMRLAQAKARTVASRYPDAIIIGSDQVASLGATLLDKPGTLERAHSQLSASSGERVEFHTGLCVIAPQQPDYQVCSRVSVVFRVLSAAEIESYLLLEPALDCAGSFKCEGLGISLFESIESDDPTSLEGLPLIALARVLRELGIHPLLQGDQLQ
jgi:septum formation protein